MPTCLYPHRDIRHHHWFLQHGPHWLVGGLSSPCPMSQVGQALSGFLSFDCLRVTACHRALAFSTGCSLAIPLGEWCLLYFRDLPSSHHLLRCWTRLTQTSARCFPASWVQESLGVATSYSILSRNNSFKRFI